MEQRGGRIIRQGNGNSDVYIYRYVTEDTFDAYSFQLLETKRRFIGQVMTSKSPVRSADDIDDGALSYAEIKALATGNPYIKEYMELEVEVAQLKLLKSNHLNQKHDLENSIIRHYPSTIKETEERIAGYEKDIAAMEAYSPPSSDGESPEKADESRFIGMTIDGIFHRKRVDARLAIVEFCKNMKTPDSVTLGEYMGFVMSVEYSSENKLYIVRLKGRQSYRADLGADVSGNVTRIDNALRAIPKYREEARAKLDNLKKQFETAKEQAVLPFEKEDEYAIKTARLAELAIELKMGKDEPQIIDAEFEESEYDGGGTNGREEMEQDCR